MLAVIHMEAERWLEDTLAADPMRHGDGWDVRERSVAGTEGEASCHGILQPKWTQEMIEIKVFGPGH